MAENHEGIRFERRGRLGVVTLDRSSALNALSREMVQRLSLQLAAWKDDPAVAAVLVKAVAGRAFCAGGDVRVVADLLRDHGIAAATPFFREEYRCNWRVHRFPKPYIACLDGITMGGGVGISVHGSFRVATENTLFAMPETGIGFFPDVGSTWFLPRCPGEVGTWLGLTGARLKGADCVAAGLATHAIPSSRLGEVEERLVQELERGEASEVVTACLDAGQGSIGPVKLPDLQVRIDHCFGTASVSDLVERLANEPTGFGTEQLAALATKSPLSVHITLAQLRRGAGLTIEGCLALEYRMVHRVLAARDFSEGVRALLVDRDQQPRWRHNTLTDVSSAEVEAVLAPLPEGELTFDWRGL
jgi:enoyl-CoA hydratase